MFTDSSDIYDLVYSFKDYAKESDEIIQSIKSKNSTCKSILDVGCGTSEHHKYLSKYFTIDGLDLNEKFIKISKQKNLQGNYFVENIIDFNLNKQYDVITCLFSSIGYLETTYEIVSALKCFSNHLKPDGLIIVEPWFTKENWHNGKIGMLTYDKENIKICRINKSYLADDFSILNFEYLVGTMEHKIQYFKEEHKLRLTSKEEMISAFELANLDVTFDQQGLIGRGMYYGIKK